MELNRKTPLRYFFLNLVVCCYLLREITGGNLVSSFVSNSGDQIESLEDLRRMKSVTPIANSILLIYQQTVLKVIWVQHGTLSKERCRNIVRLINLWKQMSDKKFSQKLFRKPFEQSGAVGSRFN